MSSRIEPPVSRFIRERWQDTVRIRPQDDGTHLGLPHPYTVPCAKGGFEHLYYWDIYFACRGMALQGLHEQVRWNCDNLIHLLDRFGFVPNASCSYLIKCSQPPYLGETVSLVLEQSPDTAWRRRAAAALEREYDFWMRRRLLPCGLNHYGHHLADMIGAAAVPARLEQEFEWLCQGRMGMAPVAEAAERRRLADHTLAEAESGWDFTPRFGRRCAGIAAVDLNSQLYRSEQVLAGLWAGLGVQARAEHWWKTAADRAALIRRLCWDEEQGCFADWDPAIGGCLKLVTAATFHPLWAGIATPDQARRTLAVAERQLILPHGVVTCAANQSGLHYQWDYPNAWPPLQLIAWEACDRNGARTLGQRIAVAFAATVERNFAATGDLWEKYNACDGTIQVQDEYEMPAMMGWTAGAYLAARDRLDNLQRSVQPVTLTPEYPHPVYHEYLADPFCFRHGDWYYVVGTGKAECHAPAFTGPVVPMVKSRDLRHWESVGRVLELPAAPFTCFWAPELAESAGKFYMYYHPCLPGKGYHIRVAVADQPEGPYRDSGRALTDNAFSIDSHPFRDDDGQWYLFYATDFLDFDDETFRGTALVVDKLKSMTELAGNPQVVMRAHWPWQRFEAQQKSHGVVADWYTLEGPTVRKRNGRYYCFYSGGNYQNESYGVDWLEADNIFGPWLEVGCERGPQLMRSIPGQVIGPGHHSIVSDRAGNDYAVYHAWNAAMTDRLMCVDRLDWINGVPSIARFRAL